MMLDFFALDLLGSANTSNKKTEKRHLQSVSISFLFLSFLIYSIFRGFLQTNCAKTPKPKTSKNIIQKPGNIPELIADCRLQFIYDRSGMNESSSIAITAAGRR